MKLKDYLNEKYNPIMDNTKIEKELEIMIKDLGIVNFVDRLENGLSKGQFNKLHKEIILRK